MDERVINELIKQLTENLEKVESARQQVEKTVGAYDILKTEVSKYTTELGFITQNVRTMISQLEEMKERFLGNISTKIVDEIHHAVANITTTIDDVSSKISSLHNFVETKAEQIDATLNKRVDSVDSTLSNMQTKISAIDVMVASCSNQLGQLVTFVNSFKSEEKIHYENIIKKIEDQEKRLDVELDVVKKQNKMFSVAIIVLLVIIIGMLTLMSNT
ncbi:MAG: hypothetical protein IJ199_04115 [Prevotella sp.]|nr:hypothetical protein [Prevotella sp.]